MILYIIRHADLDYAHNTITPLGKEEALALGQRMSRVKLDRIYTSPLGRAIDTARPTMLALGMENTVLDWTAESMDYMQPRVAGKGGYTFAFRNGVTDVEDCAELERDETMASLVKNSDEFLASLGYERDGGVYRITRPNDERVAVFCHGGFGCNWIAWLLGMPPFMGWERIKLRTSAVTRFNFRNNDTGYTVPECDYLNDTSHLPPCGVPNSGR